MLRKVYEKVASKNTLQNQRGDEQTADGEYKDECRDGKADANPIGDLKYNNGVQWKLIILQEAPKREHNDNTSTRPVCVHAEDKE